MAVVNIKKGLGEELRPFSFEFLYTRHMLATMPVDLGYMTTQLEYSRPILNISSCKSAFIIF